MQISVYDSTDELAAHLITTVARRHGHVARHLASLDQFADVATLSPSAVVVGVERITEETLDQIAELRASADELLIYVLAETLGAQSTMDALEAGASDVLQKPVLPQELLLRAQQAAPLRGQSGQPDGAIRVGDIEVNLPQAWATKADQELVLTRMELRLLYCLLDHHGRVTPTERLLSFGWETEEPLTSTLKTHITHLRQKLRAAGGVPVVITARQMLGYVLEVEGSEPAPRPSLAGAAGGG